ncbi:MAG: RNA polymerase subunit sigma-70 [Chloroflexota bacterium]
MAYSGDHDDFQRLIDPYQHELLVHCYRILGSFEDAEDALQEALLRAWRRLDSLKAATSLRAWLYRIATNVSLDMLDTRKVRSLPNVTHPAAEADAPLPAAISEPIWLDPLPDTYIDGQTLSPEARYEIHESISLAFLMALQQLPGKQRAVLILRDVLGWKAQEVADLLEMSVVAVNSSLQRAHATLKNYQAEHSGQFIGQDANAELDDLLGRYVLAWETADSTRLIELLREDAALTMPPIPAWFLGRASIKAFLDHFVFAGQKQGDFRLVAIHANGCPAFATYQRDQAGVYQASAIHILTIQDNQITQIDDFLTFDGRLFERFNLPKFG